MPQPLDVRLRLGVLLRRSHSRSAAALNASLTPFGLTGRHLGVMLVLARDEVSSQRELIGALGSDKAGMARTVEDLDALGYLSRTQSATDKRVAELRLTAAGRGAFAAAHRAAGTTAEGLFASFTMVELEALELLLTRFVEAGRGQQ